jgi:hypothetical protein
VLECDVCIGLFVFTLTRLKKKMNKIFTLRSPLYIKYPNGETRVIEEIFQHPEGILYFELHFNIPSFKVTGFGLVVKSLHL